MVFTDRVPPGYVYNSIQAARGKQARTQRVSRAVLEPIGRACHDSPLTSVRIAVYVRIHCYLKIDVL